MLCAMSTQFNIRCWPDGYLDLLQRSLHNRAQFRGKEVTLASPHAPRFVRFCRLLGALAACSLLAVPPAAAQDGTATLHGQVIDARGTALAGIEVTARNRDTNATRTVTTDSGGRYMIPDLPAGTYDLAARMPPFPPARREGLELVAGEGEAVDLTLAIAGVEETILVTANKREENVREVPSSISVIRQDQLEDLQATQLTDFAAYVPGLQVDSGGTPGQTLISLRGIAAIAPGATVASYIDQLPAGSSSVYARAAAFALDLLPYDIERIEVLRGPQGTLYGAGAMGGLIKYVLRDPDLTHRELRVGGGPSDVQGAGDAGWDLRLGANLPLAEGSASLRVGYGRNDTPGFIDNAVDGSRGVNDGEQESARLAFLWSAGDNVSLSLAAMRQSIDSDNNANVALDPETLEPLFGDLENGLFLDEPFNNEIDVFSATLDWDLGWAAFTSATGYSETTTEQRQDATLTFGPLLPLLGAPEGISAFDLGLDLDKLTQEFRLTSRSTGDLEWQGGVFYTEEDVENRQRASAQLFDGTPIPGVDPLALISIPSSYEEIAVFGSASYALTDRFELGAGVRFASNDQVFVQNFISGVIVPPGMTSGGSDEDVFTWMVSPKFQLSEDVMLYARAATAYQPGGPNVALPDVPPAVDSATLTNYELGVKSEPLERRVLFDLTVYRIDWEDIQVSESRGGVTFLVNGGTAVTEGLELATAFKPTDRLRLGLNGAWTEARLDEDISSIGGRDGDDLPLIPELSWSATAEYLLPLGGNWNSRFGAGYRWVDDRISAVESSPNALPVEGYDALDANVDFFNDRWSLRLYAQNLTDERGYLTLSPVPNGVTGVTERVLATPVQPRTFGVAFDYTF